MSYSPQSPSAKSIELRGVYRSTRWTDCKPPGTRIIGTVDANEYPGIVVCVIGDVEPGKLQPGVEFRFFGRWLKDRANPRANNKVEKQLEFSLAIPAEPRGRQAITAYLTKRCVGIGPAVANLIYDGCGEHSVIELRRDPQAVADKVNGLAKRVVLHPEKAVAASEVLKRNVNLEETLIELEQLFDGRGFGQACKDAVIKKWGAMAPLRIRRDPFCLLLAEMPGAGFKRCDALYADLGLPMARRRRQMVCLWHAIKEDRCGHVWFSLDWARKVLADAIGGTRPSVERALRFGERIGWLASVVDSRGTKWIADATKAENEVYAAEKIKELAAWSMPESCGPVSLVELSAAEHRDFIPVRDGDRFEPREILRDDPQEFARIGRLTGICQFCGRSLLHPVSRELGYGPTCAANNGLPWSEGESVNLIVVADPNQLTREGGD